MADASVALHQRFVEVRLGAADWSDWNALSPNDAAGQLMVQAMTKKLYAAGLTDRYREILFILNNEVYPAGMPTGEFAFVRNDNVPGLGFSGTFDDTAKYGATAGVLEGIAVLYKRNAIYGCTLNGVAGCSEGPVLHELIHRYANWAVPTNYPGHWPTDGRYDSGGSTIGGRLASVGNPYSQIELYLMGLLPAAEITDAASLAAFHAIPASVGTRTPFASPSEEILVVVITPEATPLSTTASVPNSVQSFEKAVLMLVNDDFTTDTTGQSAHNNYYMQTGMRGHLTTFVPTP